MRRQIIGVMCTLLLGGCASSVNNVMQSWVGHTTDELMMKWGPPSQVIDNPSGGKVFVYVSNVSWTTPGSPGVAPTVITNGYIDAYGNFQATTYAVGGVAATPAQTSSYQRVRMFFVNSSGVIYGWRWQGL